MSRNLAEDAEQFLLHDLPEIEGLEWIQVSHLACMMVLTECVFAVPQDEHRSDGSPDAKGSHWKFNCGELPQQLPQ